MTDTPAHRSHQDRQWLQELKQRIQLDALLFVCAIAVVCAVAWLTSSSTSPIRYAIGTIGDRVLLTRTASVGNATDGKWFADELAPGSSNGRARWTQEVSQLVLPVSNIAAVSLQVAGRPGADQPLVTVSLNDQVIGNFIPTREFTQYDFSVGQPNDTATTLITIRSSTVFTDTNLYTDPRQKGVRIAEVVVAAAPNRSLQYSIWSVSALYISVLLVLWALAFRLRWGRWGRIAVSLLGLIAGIGICVGVGQWILPVVSTVVSVCLITSIIVIQRLWMPILRAIVRRMRRRVPLTAMVRWATIIAVTVATIGNTGIWRILLGAVLLIWLIESRTEPLVLQGRLLALRFRMRQWYWLGYVVLGSVVAWAMYQATFLGHADYADNAVVARNLIRGRGWVVDYVTQFYQLFPTVTHPQETWPILQPVWIAISFFFFGVHDYAARFPNVVFWGLFIWLVDRYARYRWGALVALVSVMLVTINIFMYRQLIYATSDIAFLVFATAALQGVWLLPQTGASYWRSGRFASTRAKILVTGVWTGLMLLQKPGTAAMLAFGMGVWLLVTWVLPMIYPVLNRRLLVQRVSDVALWAGIAVLVLSPYIVRNLLLFGSVVHSTESFDAWILEYTQWDAIYRIYMADGGVGPGDLPERSWLLRWGYDAIIQKCVIQLNVIQDYLLPSFVGFPWPIDEFGAAAAATGLLSPIALWSLPIGWALPIVGRQPRFWGLLVSACLPYSVFMIVYWHANEPRYWVFVLPWLALLSARGIVWVVDCVASVPGKTMHVTKVTLVLAAVLMAILPSVQSIQRAQPLDAARVVADKDMYAYIQRELPIDAVVMTRVPWQLQWYSDRGAVMIPADASATQILRIAKHYNARYLALDSLQRPNATTRAVLADMIDDSGTPFRLIYRTPAYPVNDHGRTFTMVSELYAFPDDYRGVPSIR